MFYLHIAKHETLCLIFYKLLINVGWLENKWTISKKNENKIFLPWVQVSASYMYLTHLILTKHLLRKKAKHWDIKLLDQNDIDSGQQTSEFIAWYYMSKPFITVWSSIWQTECSVGSQIWLSIRRALKNTESWTTPQISWDTENWNLKNCLGSFICSQPDICLSKIVCESLNTKLSHVCWYTICTESAWKCVLAAVICYSNYQNPKRIEIIWPEKEYSRDL